MELEAVTLQLLVQYFNNWGPTGADIWSHDTHMTS